MAITNRSQFTEYCLRALGGGVVKVDMTPEQVSDRVDDALMYFREFNSNATLRELLKHKVTQADIDNKYIPIPDNVFYLTDVLPIADKFDLFTGTGQVIKQQMNDFIWGGSDTQFGLTNYMATRNYLEDVRLLLGANKNPHFEYNRYTDKLVFDADILGKRVKKDQYIVFEAHTIIPESNTQIWEDTYLKKYAIVLLKKQWGQNLMKFEGMQLNSGMSVQGRQFYDDAVTEIAELEEKMRETYEVPPLIVMG